MSTPSTDTTSASIACTTGVLNETISTSLETTSTATLSQDIVDHMLDKCSPEIVEYIFSFTTSEHASAAGFFKHAFSFLLEKPLSHWHPNMKDNVTLLRYALLVGDLPMVRHLIFNSHPSCSAMSASDWRAFCQNSWQYNDTNIHAFMYMYHLIDCKASPLRGYIDIIGDLHTFFSELHKRATERKDIHWLDFLYRSTFSRNNQQPFAHWATVANRRMMVILEHAHEHHYFGPNDTDIMNLMLNSNWDAGLEFCYNTSGRRFQKWGDLEHRILTDIRNSEVRAIMYKFYIFPEDMCPGCRDHWFPRIGYWGVVEAYKYNNGGPTVHACSDFQQRLMHDNGPVCKIADSAWEYDDMHVLKYLMECGSDQPLMWIFFKLLKRGDVELLRSVCERHERVVQLLYVLPLLQKENFVRNMLRVAMENKDMRVIFIAIDRAVLSQAEELNIEWDVLAQTLKWDSVIGNLRAYCDMPISNVLTEEGQPLVQFW